MADEKEVVDETTEQAAAAEDVDYDKELEVAVKKTQAQIGYEKRHQKDVAEDSDLATQVADKLFPKLQAQQEQVIRTQRIADESKGNEGYKKLLEHHLDHSTNPNAPFEERFEVAVAVANRKKIQKTVSEINIAQQNRSQIASGSTGTSTEAIKKPGQNIVSEDQLKSLKARAEIIGRSAGWSEAKKEKFVEDAIKNLSVSR